MMNAVDSLKQSFPIKPAPQSNLPTPLQIACKHAVFVPSQARRPPLHRQTRVFPGIVLWSGACRRRAGSQHSIRRVSSRRRAARQCLFVSLCLCFCVCLSVCVCVLWVAVVRRTSAGVPGASGSLWHGG